MTTDACCAHLRVSWREEQVVADIPAYPSNGAHVGWAGGPMRVTRGWWECDSGCGATFAPEPTPRVAPGGEPEPRYCRHPLYLSDDRRWVTCPICKADWPAAAIAPGEITPGPIPTSEEPAAHEVLVFAPLCPVSEGELTAAYLAQVEHTNVVRAAYQARVTALDSRLATALEARARAEQERDFARNELAAVQSERNVWRDFAIRLGVHGKTKHDPRARILSATITADEALVRYGTADVLFATLVKLHDEFKGWYRKNVPALRPDETP